MSRPDTPPNIYKNGRLKTRDELGLSATNDLLCEPWPIKDVLRKLVEAANILLNDHDYDGHGWEQINAARDKAIEIIKST